MPLTYLDIVNFVLHDTNEASLTSANFMQTRGFHSFVKEAVNRALMDMANESDEWPWLANLPQNPCISAHTDSVKTDRRKALYEFPDNIMDVDWDSFVVVDMSGKTATPLRPISYEEWQQQSSSDVLANRSVATLSRPQVIYKIPDGTGFGVSPVPDRDYRIQFIGWHSPTLLFTATDTLPFPERFYTVLVSRARYYAWMFRENIQQASAAKGEFEQGIKRMKQSLLKPTFNRMRAV